MASDSSGGSSCGTSAAPTPAKPSEVEIMSGVQAMATFTVSGTAQYERYNPTTTGSTRIDYTGGVTTLPIRRAKVEILSGTTVLASGSTNDLGAYSISVSATAGASLYTRVHARSVQTAYAADGVGGASTENCSGASWDVRVVNNVTNNACSQTVHDLRPQYVLDSSAYTAPASGSVTSNLTAAMTYASGAYSARSGAPFALLDVALLGIEVACQGRAGITFPLLYMNWSKDNTNTSGNRYSGNISTSFFTTEGTNSVATLYILGKAGVDTDELDRHVVAHEFGHYLENKIYRADSIGGTHSLGDSLDTRLAFGEGFGNAFSGMVHGNAVYIDTYGTGQASGFSINVSTAPSSDDDRGPWSERSMQYFLWSLWEARDGTANSGDFVRIHTVLENSQKVTSGVTNGLTFASYYAETYGLTAEGLQTLWTGAGNMASPINALCSGACTGTGDTFSPYDPDNDLGTAYASTRKYKQSSSNSFTAPFWQIYRSLSSGANTATAHDQISFGGYSVSAANLNKYGVHRLYRLTATASTTTVTLSGPSNCSTADLLDMAAYSKGTRVALDESSSGATANCPRVSFASTAGQVYIIDVYGFGAVSSYDLTVSP